MQVITFAAAATATPAQFTENGRTQCISLAPQKAPKTPKTPKTPKAPKAPKTPKVTPKVIKARAEEQGWEIWKQGGTWRVTFPSGKTYKYSGALIEVAKQTKLITLDEWEYTRRGNANMANP